MILSAYMFPLEKVTIRSYEKNMSFGLYTHANDYKK